MSRHPSQWTEDEDSTLARMYSAGDHFDDIARAVAHPVSSCRSRVGKLARLGFVELRRPAAAPRQPRAEPPGIMERRAARGWSWTHGR